MIILNNLYYTIISLLLHFTLATRRILESLRELVALVLAAALLKNLLHKLVPGARLAGSLASTLLCSLSCRCRTLGHLGCSTRSCEKTTTPKLLPGSRRPLKCRRPFRNRVLTSHGQITSIADRNKILNRRGPALGFRNTVTGLKIKHIDLIGTPAHRAFLFKHTPHFRDPDLLSEGLGNRGLFIAACRTLGTSSSH